MDYSTPGSSICGDIQAKILEWVAVFFRGFDSLPRNQTHVSYIYLRWGAGSLPLTSTNWETHQAPLSSTVSQSLLKLTSIESVMPSNHLILCRPTSFLQKVVVPIFSQHQGLFQWVMSLHQLAKVLELQVHWHWLVSSLYVLRFVSAYSLIISRISYIWIDYLAKNSFILK